MTVWIQDRCGCCSGIKWGGDIPVECDRCGGGGIRWISESDRVAAYPGGPFLGREPGEFARALARVGVALDVV
jgi:hypothetical protein